MKKQPKPTTDQIYVIPIPSDRLLFRDFYSPKNLAKAHLIASEHHQETGHHATVVRKTTWLYGPLR